MSQVNDVNLLASNSDFLFSGEKTFVIHTDGDVVIDLLKCAGTPSIRVGNSMKEVEKMKSKSFDLLTGEQPHVMHAISHDVADTSLYLKIKADLAFLRWMPVNFEHDIGTGYTKFAVGDMKYTSNFKMITVSFQPLQFVKNSKSIPEEV